MTGDNNNTAELYRLSEFFRVLGDSTRLRILAQLEGGEACVSDLAGRIESTQSAVSHQLSVLKANRLVKQRREGKQIYYALADEHILEILQVGREHTAEER